MIAARACDAKKRRKRVSGSAMFVSTGTAFATSGTNAWIARLRSAPRPAKASPKPRRLCWLPTRVGLSNMLKKSSNSTGVGGRVLERDRAALREALLASSPRVISMYLRPSADRGRTMIVESTGSGLIRVSSFRSSFAITDAVVLLDGRDLVDHADAQAADPHLVALHEAGRDRHLGREAVGRHPRQARVRVVGEEDRDHDHERGRDAHEDGVRSDRGGAAPPGHWPSPSR